MGLDAIRQYPFLELARMPAFLLEIPNFSRFLHLVRTIFHFFQNTMRIRLRIHSSMLWMKCYTNVVTVVANKI